MSEEIIKNRWAFDLEKQLFPKIKEMAMEKFKSEYPGVLIVSDGLDKDRLEEIERVGKNMGDKCKIKHGIKNDIVGRPLIPGEFAIDLGNRKLLFCFEKDRMTSLNIDETVSEEKADELIILIKWFIENSFASYKKI